MDDQITNLLEQMAKSQEELARILLGARDIARHTASELVGTLPNHEPAFRGRDECLRHALGLAGNVSAYLSGIGDLQEALADSLEPVMAQLREPEEE